MNTHVHLALEDLAVEQRHLGDGLLGWPVNLHVDPLGRPTHRRRVDGAIVVQFHLCCETMFITRERTRRSKCCTG